MTVEEIMKHEAGLAKFPRRTTAAETHSENIKKNSIGSIIESAKSIHLKDSKRQYHGTTRDWLTGEIFRRVDPDGRTFGEYYA